jgi:hypothetical protein
LLIGAPHQIARAKLAQIVVEDRLRTPVAELLDQLSDPLARRARIAAQQALNLLPKGIELRRSRRPPITRRLGRAKRATDRLPITTSAAPDLLDREPLDECMRRISAHCSTPTNSSSWPRPAGPSQAQSPTGERRPGGPVFNRRRVRSIQAAPTGIRTRDLRVMRSRELPRGRACSRMTTRLRCA